VNKLKIHYFFSKNENILGLLRNMEVEIRLTDGADWDKIISNGHFKPFEYLEGSKFNLKKDDKLQDGTAKREHHMIHLLSKRISDMTVDCTVGLNMDHDVETENLRLYPQYGIFFPDSNYHNCNPLPIEWLDIFERVIT
jgi:hypothetical protein